MHADSHVNVRKNSYFVTYFVSHSQIPHSLFKAGGYEHREALFGIPPYGGSIAQNVYHAESDLCDEDATVGYHDKTGKIQLWPSPFILMVDRGNCTFVKKVSLLSLE